MADTKQTAVAGVGAALVAVALAAGLGFVAHHDPPKEFWTLASGLAGGLLGLLAPTPTSRAAKKANQAAAAKAVKEATAGPALKDALSAQKMAGRVNSWTALVVLLVLFLVCEAFLLFYHPPFFTEEVGKQLQALAAAAAGAAVGLLAPPPGG